MKRCPRCGKLKKLSAFGKNAANKNKRATYCRLCRTERREESYKPQPGDYVLMAPQQQRLAQAATFLSLGLQPLRVTDEEFDAMFIGRSSEADEGIKAIQDLLKIVTWAIEQGEQT